MPAAFRFPSIYEVWQPLKINEGAVQPRAGIGIRIWARMRPGVTPEQANAELAVLGAQHAVDELLRRIAHQGRAEPGTAVASDGDEPANVVECRLDLAVDQLERDAGQKDAVEEAFQDRGIAVVPDREAHHEALGGQQAPDIGIGGVIR